jgi:hypothetical protein
MKRTGDASSGSSPRSRAADAACIEEAFRARLANYAASDGRGPHLRPAHDITTQKEALPRSEPNSVGPAVDSAVELTRCFLRLANLPNFALDRLSRYEATLWRTKPARPCLRSTPWIGANHKSGRRFRIGSWQSVSADARGSTDAQRVGHTIGTTRPRYTSGWKKDETAVKSIA